VSHGAPISGKYEIFKIFIIYYTHKIKYLKPIIKLNQIFSPRYAWIMLADIGSTVDAV